MSLRSQSCVVCGGAVIPHASSLVRNKHRVDYFRCTQCGSIQTENPYWLKEAYAEPINRSDVGYISRNLRFRDATRLLVDLHLNPKSLFLDYGAGYGMFVRLMRDAGYDFRGYDPFCQSLFSPDFCVQAMPPERYELVTAFEVLEHLLEPRKELARIFSLTDSFLFSTECLPSKTPQPGEWNYYGLDHGQHITLYSQEGLRAICGEFGATYHHLGNDLHFASRHPISGLKLAALRKSKLARIYSLRPAKHSRLLTDHQAILQKLSATK